MPLPILQVENALLADAAEILAARAKALIIHRTKDIDAAGDEVEIAARRVIASRLPARCVVKHGHIVDSALKTSTQLDVIIADAGTSTSMLKTANGSEYMPFESVYAIGEIKSCYYASKKYFESFVKKLDLIRDELLRAPSPPHPLVTPVQSSGNALFSFMLFADAYDFEMEQVADLYRTHPADRLPNMCAL